MKPSGSWIGVSGRSVRRFQAYLIDRLTIGSYQNELTSYLIARPGFYLNNAKPWLTAIADGDNAAAIYNVVAIDDIRCGANDSRAERTRKAA